MRAIATDLGRLGLSAHPEQELMARWMPDDADAGAISLIEAPPAAGKTLAMAWHALGLAQRTGERVLMAVPTLAVLRQTIAAVRRLAEAAFPEMRADAVFGRQEFVNPDLSRDWIARFAPDALPTYEEWTAAQGDFGWTRSSLDQAMRAVGFDLDLPAETSLLARRNAQAQKSYARQYDTDAQVIVATHALLARDVAARTGRRADDEIDAAAVAVANERRIRLETAEDRILPEWRHLVVDEAHQLASGFMMALTSHLSFHRLLRILDERASSGAEISEDALDKLHRAVALHEGSPPRGLRRTQRLSMELRHHSRLVRQIERCIPEDASRLGAEPSDTDYLARFRDAAVLAQRGRRLVAPSITWSDVQGRLGLSITPLSFLRQLDFCFRSCRTAALLSATLYAHDDDLPEEHVVRQLALPAERVRAHDAIPADWATRTVTLHLPSEAASAMLNPTRRDWGDALAVAVANAAEVGGGTLVLATSHETVAALAGRLADHGPRVMTTDDRGVAAAAERFASAARRGDRPIWIATGPAWTGLDLPDDVVDALVVTRLPYGLANPILHEHLTATVRSRAGFRDMETDMLKVLRQGIGRLVRDRAATRPRALWIADGRIVGHVAGARALTSLREYRNRTAFEIPE